MAESIEVDFEALADAAADLRRCTAELVAQVGAVETLATDTQRYWDGQARQAAAARIRTWGARGRDELTELTAAEGYLNRVAVAFDRVEQAAVRRWAA